MCHGLGKKKRHLGMRTTINVNEQLLKQAKAQAAALGVSLAQLIEDALRERLCRREPVCDGKRVRIVTMKGQGMRPGVDLDNHQSLLEIMDR
jgi:anthranilate phosphoribosyltransferase